jgi:hypothetical protein
MVCARDFHTATLLNNGKVLLAGGRFNGGTGEVSISCAEAYDRAAGTFTPAGNLTTVRALHTATLLPSGKVLIAGGIVESNGNSIGTAELYDPNNATTPFTATTGALSTARGDHTATLLTTGPNAGKVLIAGGLLSTSGVPVLQTLTSAEIYDPSTDTFTNSASQMTQGRYRYRATLLKNGKILLAGGLSSFQASPGGFTTNNILNSAELYDPTADSFSTTGSLSTARGEHAGVRIEVNGTVLITGGNANNFSAITSTSEIYVP